MVFPSPDGGSYSGGHSALVISLSPSRQHVTHSSFENDRRLAAPGNKWLWLAFCYCSDFRPNRTLEAVGSIPISFTVVLSSQHGLTSHPSSEVSAARSFACLDRHRVALERRMHAP